MNEYLAFGEQEWLNLEAFKQIPPSSSETANAFVPKMPSKGVGKYEHVSCEL